MTLLTVHQDNHPTPATTATGTGTSPHPAAQTDPTMPRLTTTVPREYVHRSTLAEVFLTGCEQTGDTHYTLTAQWPRAHTFFTTPDGTHHHPLQAAETIRQTGLYLAHAELGIPLGHHFLMRNLHLTTHPQHLTIGPTPTDLTLTATYTPHHPHTKRPTDFTMHITITRNGHPTATGTGRFTCLTPTTYQRLRHPHTTTADTTTTDTTTSTSTSTSSTATQHQPPNPPPTHYGRTLPHDIVLTPTPHPHTWQLTPNPHHPILFDHTTDHIPGMVLLEAAHQAATAHTHPTPTTHPNHPTTLHATFHHYTEHHTPTYITTHTTRSNNSDPAPTTHITAHQNNTTVFTAQLTTHTPTDTT
ncbi:A-factor biosynthesis hotdog protein [Streptomyces sp. Ag82_O1-15]|uniref:ScbA/BarX family gamma-butyrolactone biosynthesis protein n=1 Tax=Streptomyces sp. Ag82_O1-15 TaxID=1938855 RepID=UPI000BD0C77C|nr:ScbA/BarX family gamma-butyrolactone biosynthesis protein [Streptomyces sp. Ag82_O1-15]PBD02201.1 A-factor biosynthesis hotdog protein [Streptomyces sp. Ag82_O1-15]